MDLKLKVSSYYPSLTKSEQKVADYVLGAPESIMYRSVTELADLSGVGETTVMRFCRAIGFKGYQDFKLALAQDYSTRRQRGEGSPEAGEEDGDYPSLVHRELASILADTMNLLDRTKLEEAVRRIHEAGYVQLFGVGTSGLTALDAKNRLLRIGLRAEAATDAHIQAMMAVTMGPGDVAVGISLSGSTLDTVDLLSKARQQGAYIIAITNYAKSPITAEADLVLLTAGKESPLEGGSIGAKMSQLLVIDLICEGLARHDLPRTREMRERMAKAVIERIY
ncbi:MurR/RpiR family transcriptional regulator [Paenibacillus pasadenensis]|uniref:Sialic acid utilization regulator, RpiR family n=1 Tax=Paenibacillus pasadenensis TaxID=217090 RepID=A0A2N5N1Y7_9BACL|nr:MurR/RpiR family transcriptional regulator [Paenibacillus pasadenensis]PLT44348.1 Sialic acid utilization regulator, RpiR family [Paenibacillus pasadenensis]